MKHPAKAKGSNVADKHTAGVESGEDGCFQPAPEKWGGHQTTLGPPVGPSVCSQSAAEWFCAKIGPRIIRLTL